MLNFDHSILIGNAVRWALGARSRVEVTGPGVLDIATREGDGKLAVHLVNLTNPMMMKGPIREIIPVGKQVVSVALPAGCSKAAAVRLLVSGGSPCDADRGGPVGDRGGRNRHERSRADRFRRAKTRRTMLKFVLKRLLYMIPTLIGMSMVSFFIIQLPPGDFLTSLISAIAELQARASTRRRSPS